MSLEVIENVQNILIHVDCVGSVNNDFASGVDILNHRLDIFDDFKTHAEFDNIEIEWIDPPASDEMRKDPARVLDLVNADG